MSGNEEVNESKLAVVLGGTVRPGHPEELMEISGADAGSIGPVGFKHKIIADLKLKDGNNLYSGANKNDYHIGGIDMNRDVPNIEYHDLRFAQTGEKCIRCGSKLDVFKAIELGHIFKLGTKYSESLGALFLDEEGKEHPIIMGSYGIGIERIIACYIDQNCDDKGIIWDMPLAPYHIHLIGINIKNQTVVNACNKLYDEISALGYEVLFDDRDDVSAGFKFNDADLLGMPVQLIIGEKNLKDGNVELKKRRTNEKQIVKLDQVNSELKELL